MFIKSTLPSSARTEFKGVVAHRGSRTRAPENTMASFRAALEDGAKIFELDVSETSDLRSVVHHDDTLDRTTNGTGKVSDHTFEEVRSLDAGSWFDPQFAGEKVPSLEEVLGWAKDKIHVDVEIKKHTATPEYADRLLDIINEQGMAEQVTVTSFNADFIENLERQKPELNTGLLIAPHKSLKAAGVGGALGLVAGLGAGLAAVGSLPGALAGAALGLVGGALTGRYIGSSYARRAIDTTSADAVIPHWSLAGPGMIKRAHDEDKNFLTYTVNKPIAAKALKLFGADGIVTDAPVEMQKIYS